MEVLSKFVLPLACLAVTLVCGWATVVCVLGGHLMGGVCCAAVGAGNGWFFIRDVKTKWLKK